MNSHEDAYFCSSFLNTHYTFCFHPRSPCSFSVSLSPFISFPLFFSALEFFFLCCPFRVGFNESQDLPSLYSFFSLPGFYFSLPHGFNLYACGSKFMTLSQILWWISRPIQPIVSLPVFLDSPQAFQILQILSLPPTFPPSCLPFFSEQHHYLLICPGQKLGYRP